MLSNLIKENRNKLGILQENLAMIIGVDKSYIAKIESGILKKPSIIILIKLCYVLNIDIFELLEYSEYSKNEINVLIKFIKLYKERN